MLTDEQAHAIADKVMAETVIVLDKSENVFLMDSSNLYKWDDPDFIKFLTDMDLEPSWAVWDEFHTVDEIVRDDDGVYNLHFRYEVIGRMLKVEDVVLTIDDDNWYEW